MGPDYIDPGHHTRITTTVSRNLDGWMLSRRTNLASFHTHTRGCDIAVVEGVMGLFDGYDGRSEEGSTAQMAKWLGLPVLLVVDARSMARSAAALVHGFETFDPDLAFAGVLFNNVGSPRHLDYLKESLEGHVRMPCLGGIGRETDAEIPERHLGLYTAEDHALKPAAIERFADLIEDGMDVGGLLSDLSPYPKCPTDGGLSSRGTEKKVRLGVAADNAFCFYYQDNLDLLASFGAEIVRFSPLADRDLPADLDGLYFGGGYPELFAERLSSNGPMRRQVLQAVKKGMPVYGECGGFMYLGRSLVDVKGRTYGMAGCFPLDFEMNPQLRSLGYREVTLTERSLLGPKGRTLRGHEFHYSKISGQQNALKNIYRVTTRAGLEKPVEGFQINRCLGSYAHLHMGSNTEAARAFVFACRTYQNERNHNNETR